MSNALRLVVVVASVGRPTILGEMLQHLQRQTRLPDEVIVSIVDDEDVPRIDVTKFPVRVIRGPKGSSAQRNSGLEAALPQANIVTFFDDDFFPSARYLDRVEAAFAAHSDFAVVHGNVVADGICSAGLTVEEGLAILGRTASIESDPNPTIVDDSGAYGCNMSFRASSIRELRFDERLVLYGWQEDRDFSFRVGRRGRVVRISNIVGVHLGVKGGRVSGLRLGYSQVINPIYLVGKGTMPLGVATRLMFRNIAANAIKSFRPEPWVDRSGRLRGNIIAIRDVFTGHVEPERVLKL